MDKHTVTGKIIIRATPAEVWEALTRPDKIVQYTGSVTETIWSEGSPITWSGEMHGAPYCNKGRVLEVRPYNLLRYTYWSGMGGDADSPENYSEIRYTLDPSEDGVELSYTREHIPTELEAQIFAAHIDSMLDAIRKVAEQGRSLCMVRRFDVSPEVVFDAFTVPESMRAWWTEDTVFEIDLRIGGRWTISRPEEGVIYTMTGEYLEVDRPHRLQHTISMPQFSPNSDLVTIDIAADGAGGSTLTFIQSGPDIAAELRDLPEGSVSESEKGWQQGFDLIATAREQR